MNSAGRHEVMVVDDNPNNLRLLEDMLLAQGHAVRSFPLGRLALNAAQKAPPDLILLDINMPEMNGYEVCARFKESVATRNIPVIFLSALTDVKDKVRAFQAGGVDYVSKPFQFEEVQARVDTQLRLHKLQIELRRYNEKLEETVRERTRDLERANTSLRLLDEAKGEFLQLISHELRTPLHGLLGSFELMLLDMPEAIRTGEMRQMFDHSRDRILSIVEDALLLTEVDVRQAGSGEGIGSRISIPAAFQSAAEQVTALAEARGVHLLRTASPDGCDWWIPGEARMIARAFRSLIETVVRIAAPGETVRLTAGGGEVSVEARSKPDGDAALTGLLDLFSAAATTSANVTMLEELGLSPAVANRLLRVLGAELGVENAGCFRLTASWKHVPAQPVSHVTLNAGD